MTNMQNYTNGARDRYRLRRARYRELFAQRVADEPNTTISPELVRQIDMAAKALATENEQLREALKRQKADFDNFRRRTQKEKEELRDAANEAFIAKLLPVLDNFERAIASAQTATDVAAVRQGVEMVAAQLNSLLQSEGLTKIDAAGVPFDPQMHEALSVEERSDLPDGQVVEVLQAGYKYKDRVIRPALVKVAKHPSTAASNK